MTRYYDPNRHHRRSIRLKDYDYTQPGAYFVTLVTHGRAHLFGTVVNGAMQLNEAGRIAEQCWKAIPHHFPHVALDVFVIMPNHIHGILWIIQTVGAKNFSPLPTRPIPLGTSKTIGSVVRGFKTGVTKWFRQNTPIYPIWQRNYFEHIIRTERTLNLIRRYIAENPLRWALDRYNPERKGTDPLASEIWATMKTEGAQRPSPLSPVRHPEDIA